MSFSNERVQVRQGEMIFWTRPALLDETVIDEVIRHDGYGLLDLPMFGKTVIDLGGHVGIFSVFCAVLGAKRVVTVEPQPENLELLALNAAPYSQIEIVPLAIGATLGQTWIVGESGGAHTIDGANEGSLVDRTTLAVLLDAATPHGVDLLKLDMEGAEVATLLACDHDRLAHVGRIVMETHGPTSCPWVERPHVGEIIEHLLPTHNVRAEGDPRRLGKLTAIRNGANVGW